MLSDKKQCYVCGTTQNLEVHHIFYGTSNRKNSTKYGMVVYLCRYHHTGSATESVHGNPNHGNDLRIKHDAQQKWLNEGHTKKNLYRYLGNGGNYDTDQF